MEDFNMDDREEGHQLDPLQLSLSPDDLKA
jgi:hypothetical protein